MFLVKKYRPVIPNFTVSERNWEQRVSRLVRRLVDDGAVSKLEKAGLL